MLEVSTFIRRCFGIKERPANLIGYLVEIYRFAFRFPLFWDRFMLSYKVAAIPSTVGVVVVLLNSLGVSDPLVVFLDPHAPALSIAAGDLFSPSDLPHTYWATRAEVTAIFTQLLEIRIKFPRAVFHALPPKYCTDPEFMLRTGCSFVSSPDTLYERGLCGTDLSFESWSFPQGSASRSGLSFLDF